MDKKQLIKKIDKKLPRNKNTVRVITLTVFRTLIIDSITICNF